MKVKVLFGGLEANALTSYKLPTLKTQSRQQQIVFALGSLPGNAAIIAVVVANLISLNRRSHYLGGTLLLTTYIVLGTPFFFP